MKRLWVAAALAPLSFAAANAANAQTCTGTPIVCTISNSSGTAVTTGTVNSGSPANIALTGTIAPTSTSTAAAAITVNSSNTVSNSGAISYTGLASTASPIGILVNPGVTTLITNTGSITVSETTTGTTTVEGYTSGPFANGGNRFGIDILPGVVTGVADASNPLSTTNPTVIDTTGSISVIGENSAGILNQATLNGDVIVGGTISVTGGSLATTATPGTNSDVSYGIHSTGAINGNVSLTGSISATGQNAVGLALDQGVNGALSIGDTIVATGYRTTTNPGLVIAPLLNADQVLQGGPGAYIGGSVTGGINVVTAVAAVAATSTTAAVTAVSAGTISSYGSAPALLIGGQNPLSIGQVGTTGADLTIGGSISAQGVYDNLATSTDPTAKTTTANPNQLVPLYNATAVQLGGTNTLPVAIGGVASGANFGAVTLADGMTITGSVGTNTLSDIAGHGNAVALDIGNGASVLGQGLTVSGTLAATAQVLSGGVPGSAGSTTTSSTALEIDSGGALHTLTNSGIIEGSITPLLTLTGNVENYTGGLTGTPTAVLDNAGSLNSITTNNTITAEFATSAGVITARGTAFNLSANTTGVTLTQTYFPTASLATGVTSLNPSITGDILFGSGVAVLNAEAGTINGNLVYGANTGNQLNIGDVAIPSTAASTTAPAISGGLYQAAGGSLALNIVNGSLTITSPLSTAVGGATTALNLSSLNVAATGQLTVTVNPTDANATSPQFLVAGATNIATGAKIGLQLTSVVSSPETFVLIQNTGGGLFNAGTVTTNFVGGVPFIYTPTLDILKNGTSTGSLAITLTPKTAADLTGFSAAEKAEYSAFLRAFPTDTGTAPNDANNTASVLADVLSKTDQAAFRQTYDQFLPDFSGGPYQTMEIGQEAIYRAEADAPLKLQTDQQRGWVQEIGYVDHRDNSDSGGYDGSGFGVIGGVENAHGDNAIGLMAAFLTSNVKDAGQSASGHLSSSVLEGGAYWRSGGTGLHLNASVNGGWAFFDSQRLLVDTSSPDPVTGDTTALQRVAQSTWNGGVVAAHVGVSYPFTTGRFYLRPEGWVDYFALFEGGHSERGGGTAFDLTVAGRTSQEAIAQADMVLGATFGDSLKWRPELTIGYRQVVEGGPAATTARFESGGSSFTILPDFQDKGGLLARLGIRAGGQFADFSADAGGEYRNGSKTYDARASAKFLF
jgi:hypothetical protein